MAAKRTGKGKKKGLTPRQAKFVDKYIETGVGKTAAIKAGYAKDSANVEASRLLANANVAEAVGNKARRVAELAELNAANVLRELQRVAMVDIRTAYSEHGRLLSVHELPEDTARAVASVETEELWGSDGDGGRVPTGDVRKLKMLDKVRALELLGKHFALFTEKVELSGKLSFEQLVEQSFASPVSPAAAGSRPPGGGGQEEGAPTSSTLEPPAEVLPYALEDPPEPDGDDPPAHEFIPDPEEGT